VTRRKNSTRSSERRKSRNRLGSSAKIRHPHNELKMIPRVIDGAGPEGSIQRRAEMAEKRERF